MSSHEESEESEESEQESVSARANLAFERNEFEAARALFLRQQGRISKDDLNSLLSADKHAMRQFLRQAWADTRFWYAGRMLAEVSSSEESMQIYEELLRGQLSEPERWRIQCKRLNLMLTRGRSGDGLVENFLSAWEYLERLGTEGKTLRRGMAQMLSRADNEFALDFLDQLLAHPDFPPVLVELVELKKRELTIALAIG